MAIIRACSYSVAIRTPVPPSSYSHLIVTFAQDQEILAEKSLSEMVVSEGGVLVSLTQAETAQFRPTDKSPMGRKTGGEAFVQLRAYKEPTDAPGSKCWKVPVYDSLNEGALTSG